MTATSKRYQRSTISLSYLIKLTVKDRHHRRQVVAVGFLRLGVAVLELVRVWRERRQILKWSVKKSTQRWNYHDNETYPGLTEANLTKLWTNWTNSLPFKYTKCWYWGFNVKLPFHRLWKSHIDLELVAKFKLCRKAPTTLIETLVEKLEYSPTWRCFALTSCTVPDLSPTCDCSLEMWALTTSYREEEKSLKIW